MNKLKLVFIIYLIILISGCKADTIQSNKKHVINLLEYIPDVGTKNYYNYYDENGGIFYSTSEIFILGENEGTLIKKIENSDPNLNSTTVYQISKDEIIQVYYEGALGAKTNEEVFLTILEDKWGKDIEYNIISAIDVTVKTDLFEVENCIEVTLMYEGEEYSKTYYGPGLGEIVVNIVGQGKFKELSFRESYVTTEEYELIDAAALGNLNKVKSIIKKKININCKNEYDITPLMEAARNGHKEIVNLLINNGADVNILAVNGDSGLLWAVEEEYVDIIELFINAGADTNIKGNFDRTPLLVACELGNIEIARVLLNNGADPNLKLVNEDESTPLSIAQDKGITELVKLLKDY